MSKQTEIFSYFKANNRQTEPSASSEILIDSTPGNLENSFRQKEAVIIDNNYCQESDSENSEDEPSFVAADTSALKKSKRRKHVQKFSEKYKEKFQWVVNRDGKSYCKYCQKNVEGSYSHLMRHENRLSHKKKIAAVKNVPNLHTFETKMDEKKLLAKRIKECELKLTALVIEHNLPMILMDHLPRLLASAAPDSEIFKNVHCSRTKTTALLKNFQEESGRSITSILKDTKYSVIVDETTDVSVKKCLAILVRYVDVTKEQVKDRLLALTEVSDLTSEGILKKILDTLSDLIPLPNLVGFAADNASVMQGKYNGVQAKLREINSDIFVIGCICHSLHLCSSAAAAKLPKEIEDFVRDIYNYLNCSSKRIVEYKEFQDYVNLKPHKLLRPSQTRWLSLEAVVKRTLEQWPALLLYFNAAVLEDNLVAASTIHNALNNVIFKLYLTFLGYILPLINKLNLQFQAESPQIHNIYDQIERITKTIFKNFMKNDYVDKTPFLQWNELNVREYKPIENIYLGANVEIIIQSKQIDGNTVNDFKLKCLSYYIELCSQLKKRFCNIDAYKIFKCLNPQEVLSGNSSITPLLVQFPNICLNKNEEISSEFREICNMQTSVKTEFVKLDLVTFWFRLFKLKNTLNDKCFENVCLFVFNILSLPHSSACAERIFSDLNNIKTKNRNRLLASTTNSLLLGKEVLDDQKCYEWVPTTFLINKKVDY